MDSFSYAPTSHRLQDMIFLRDDSQFHIMAVAIFLIISELISISLFIVKVTILMDII